MWRTLGHQRQRRWSNGEGRCSEEQEHLASTLAPLQPGAPAAENDAENVHILLYIFRHSTTVHKIAEYSLKFCCKIH